MPTNLGAMRSNTPAPTGLCQIKRGVVDNSLTVNNVSGVGALQDGAGANMTISITPSVPGWWVIRAETIWNQVDPVWTYWHWGVMLNVADVNGMQEVRNHCAQHSAMTWNESAISVAFRLAASTAYTASMWWYNASSGYNQQYWTGQYYHYIMGEFVQDASL